MAYKEMSKESRVTSKALKVSLFLIKLSVHDSTVTKGINNNHGRVTM